jgi:dephospho-CoA kinase
MTAIEEKFGREYVSADGSLDRARMRSLVFSDAAARATLEAILHPLIRTEVGRRIQVSAAPYAILVVPLLLETGAYRELLDRVLVVDCEEFRQIERAMARSRLSEDDVRRIMSAQLPRADRLRQANDVVSNDADIETLRKQVEAMHEKYLAEAAAVR